MIAVSVAAVLIACVAAFTILSMARPVPAGAADVLMTERLRSKVVATLKSGASFQGVLFEADERSLVLRDAVALSFADRDNLVPVDGELVLARADVDYLQRP